uniref:U6 small nuclear RNA (adenine-(43)-N(6))-methyltransferase n=1 Tax=Leucosporidium scottii TaxID=5278 RepID=A0A0H5FTU2_9BASI|nr:hypothetical protein ls5930a1_00173 [Leucosporidium scottii]CRX79207.1 hypothetical protein ls5931a1_00046 [Leucosporidium scottii]
MRPPPSNADPLPSSPASERPAKDSLQSTSRMIKPSALTAALLKRDFQLDIDLPEDRLCPIVPGRFVSVSFIFGAAQAHRPTLEYMLWVLQLSLRTLGPTPAPPTQTGLDIGTGSSCIYPLLGCRSYPSLHFVATDVDDHSLSYARHNVQQNRLADQVDVRKVQASGSMFPAGDFDFTMCNPPFYSGADEVSDSLAAKELEPYAICTGGANEMVTEGGEVAFVGRMVEESLTCGERIRWFSSLLGKYSSIAPLVAQLQRNSIENYTIKELSQGQTQRYILAWSLQSARLPSVTYHPRASEYTNQPLAKLLPPSNAHTYFCPPSLRPADVKEVLALTVDDLDGSDLGWREPSDPKVEVGILQASKNGWSRSARRNGKGSAMATDEDYTIGGATGPSGIHKQGGLLLEAVVTIKMEGQQVKVEAEWTKGFDRARKDWATLWAYLIRRLVERAKQMSTESGSAADAMEQ